jgi:hypothetical protein
MRLVDYPSTVVTISFHERKTGQLIVETIEELVFARNAALDPNQYLNPSAHRINLWKEVFYHDGELARIGQSAGKEHEVEQVIVLPSLDSEQRFRLSGNYSQVLVVTHIWGDLYYNTHKPGEFRKATIDYASRLAQQLDGSLLA